ncbi:MAG TPA: hypothetical protein VEC12_07505, partial [Bacteroidia bacterium]|nr:hypothetical protein [Bacteroidia bacterium]
MENSNENSLNLPWSEIFSFMKLGLTSLEIISPGAKTINVKDLKLINDNSIECHFYTKYNNSIDIKTEVSTIVGFLYGFTKNTIYNGIKIKYFSTKAYDTFDTEVMYSISHLNSAKLISDGDSMDWLKSTLFQENTSEYRLGLAKKMIYEIENSL